MAHHVIGRGRPFEYKIEIVTPLCHAQLAFDSGAFLFDAQQTIPDGVHREEQNDTPAVGVQYTG